MNDDFIIRIKSEGREIVISIDEKDLTHLKLALRDWFIDNKINADIRIKNE